MLDHGGDVCLAWAAWHGKGGFQIRKYRYISVEFFGKYLPLWGKKGDSHIHNRFFLEFDQVINFMLPLFVYGTNPSNNSCPQQMSWIRNKDLNDLPFSYII